MKKSNVKIHRNNNNGSTLIIVLTIMAFLSILAVVVTSSSIVNLKMKNVDSESSKAFYTAEDAIDEIYAALGKVSMESFDEAYNEELSSVVKQISVGGTDVTYALSNITSNDNLRKNFTYKLLTKLDVLPETATKYSDEYYVKEYIMPKEIEDFVNELNSYLEESEEMLKVTSVDGISVKKTMSDANKSLFTYTFSFRNCSVKYLNESSYYSDIVFDGKIAMPDVFIEFSSEADNKREFTKYALIGNTGLNIDTGKILNLKGNVYAGKMPDKMSAIKVNEGSEFNSNSNIKIVSGGDIDVSDGEMNLSSTEVWCNSIFATGKSSTIKINGGSTFVKDDLQLDGDNSDVTIGGDYYGYGYQGHNNLEGNHNNSSSIILNGKNATLNLGGVKTLVIGGRAYIDYNSLDAKYATGESLSLKGSQEMYLVPSYLMNVTNPTVGKDVDVEISLTEDNFFGYKYLDKDKPYVSKTIKTETSEETYYYLNFIDDKASSEYVKAVFDDTIDDDSRRYVYDVIKKNISSFLGDGKVISASSSATVYTNGQMIEAEPGKQPELGDTDNDYNVEGNSIGTDGFALDSWDLSNRYSLMTKILVAPEFNDKDGNRNYLKKVGDKIIIDRKEYDISGYEENNIFENVISMDNFYKLTSENSSGYFKTLDGGSILCAIRGGTKVSDEDDSPFKGYNQGVIVASGDVIVKKNFSGTILTDGKIIISGDNVTVDNVINGSSVEKLIQENQDFSVIFNAFTPLISDSENNELNSITYKDFVEFENWRKSYE